METVTRAVAGVLLIAAVSIIGGATVKSTDTPQAHVDATVVNDIPEDATVVPVASDRFQTTPSLKTAVEQAVESEQGSAINEVDSQREMDALEATLDEEIRYETEKGGTDYYISYDGNTVHVQVLKLI